MHVSLCLQMCGVPVCLQVHMYGVRMHMYVCMWRLEVNLRVPWDRVSHLLWSLPIQPGRLGQQASGILLVSASQFGGYRHVPSCLASSCVL